MAKIFRWGEVVRQLLLSPLMGLQENSQMAPMQEHVMNIKTLLPVTIVLVEIQVMEHIKSM